MSETPAFTGI